MAFVIAGLSTGCPSGHLHSHLADIAQGGGPETALQTPPWVLFAPIHHTLQSKVSGCPRSFVCGWILFLPGLDSISIRSLWQASPKNRPLGRPACVTPRSEERRVGKECRSRWSPYH